MNRYRILLADDEQIERMALAKRLVKHFGDSLAISEAVNGAEALKVFKREQSQIVLMDISMPEMNGAEAAEQIRGMDEDCIIIFLTAYDDFAYAKRAIVIRALDYLLKPCDEDELVSVIEEAMHLTDRRELKKARDFGMDGGKALDGDIPGVRGVSMAKIPSGGAQDMAGGHGLEDAGTARMALAAETMREYIRNNYMKEISMQDAARMMNYSDAYFCKLFKQCFNKNFTSYLTEYRVEEAKKMLEQPTVNVKEIGKAVGYGDSNYFAKVFKRITGQSPTEYRLYIFQRG